MKCHRLAWIAGIAIAGMTVALSANAEGIGFLGYPNLFVNPDFEDATVTLPFRTL